MKILLRKTYFSFLPLVTIVFIALLLRLVWLHRVPTGISNDELDFVLAAKAFFLSGKDINGFSLPYLFFLSSHNPSTTWVSISYLITSPFIGILPLSLFSARLPYALLSTVLVAVLYLIAKNLFGKKIAFMVGFVAAFNPWSVFFGRTAYEAPVAVLFIFITFYILLVAKRSKILLAYPFWFLGFYSYIGTNIVFLPYLFCIAWYVWYKNKKQYLAWYCMLLTMCIFTVFSFIILLPSQRLKSRTSELLTPNNAKIIKQVDLERRLSVNSSLNAVFTNKATLFTREIMNKYIGAFSSEFLFLYGEGRSTFSLWFHGMFYYVDFAFLLLGLCALFFENRRIWILLVSLIILAPFPSVLSVVGTSYALRSSLLYPILILIIGYGIYFLFAQIKQKLSLYIFVGIVIGIYIISLANFLNIYFLRNPIYNSEGFGFSYRVLSRYLALAQSKNKTVIFVSNSPETPIKQYLFYTNGYNRKTYQKVTQFFAGNKKKYENIYFVDCELKGVSPDSIVVTDELSQCAKNLQTNGTKTSGGRSLIALLADGGGIFIILQDSICDKYSSERYPKDIIFSDFDIETLPESVFCKKFITLPG